MTPAPALRRRRRLALSIALVACIGALMTPSRAGAHELDPGFLQLRETAPGSYSVLWKVPLARGRRMPLEPVFPAVCTETAERTSRPAERSVVERWKMECSDDLAGATLAIRGLERTATDVMIRIEPLSGASHLYIVRSAQPSVVIGAGSDGERPLFGYGFLGFEHILLGIDHLLFVLGLLLIVGDRWMLLKTITAFTVAHSITLAVATLGWAAAPGAPLNAAIALSILFLGPEVVRVWRGQTSFTIRHPWVVAFAFGLLHGFGFASGLSTLGLPRAEIPIALLLFNLGVEAGQLFFVALILALEGSFRVLQIRWPVWARMFPGYAVGSLGAFWFIQRTWVLLGG